MTLTELKKKKNSNQISRDSKRSTSNFFWTLNCWNNWPNSNLNITQTFREILNVYRFEQRKQQEGKKKKHWLEYGVQSVNSNSLNGGLSLVIAASGFYLSDSYKFSHFCHVVVSPSMLFGNLKSLSWLFSRCFLVLITLSICTIWVIFQGHNIASTEEEKKKNNTYRPGDRRHGATYIDNQIIAHQYLQTTL